LVSNQYGQAKVDAKIVLPEKKDQIEQQSQPAKGEKPKPKGYDKAIERIKKL